MARQYSPKHFFRQVQGRLLTRYLFDKKIFKNMGRAELTLSKPDALYKYWEILPEDVRSQTDAEFRSIFNMSCEKGFRAILDEAEYQSTDKSEYTHFVERLSALPNHYERAMTVFLEFNPLWKGATKFHHADTLTYWRKRKNIPHIKADVNDASVNNLSQKIGDYFHITEGRGSNCMAEYFIRGEYIYIFVYAEDYSQQSIEWVKGKFDHRPHNPAFEIVYVYSQKEGTLDLNFHGEYKTTVPLQDMFAKAILNLDKLPPKTSDTLVYDLNQLLNKNFSFNYSADSGITDVSVKKIRLTPKVQPGARITIENILNDKSNTIFDSIQKINGALPAQLYNVTQIELTATFTETGYTQKKINCRITHPNYCSLKYDEIDLKLREMLKASGIEPIEIATNDAIPTSLAVSTRPTQKQRNRS
jgi:hypothetical protein